MPHRSAIIFDMDGTLTQPYFDFDAIRQEIGIASEPILEAMEKMSPAHRRRAERILLTHEREAAEQAEPYEGAAEVIDALRLRGHPVAISTRNARPNARLVIEKFGLTVDALRTREDGDNKPSPEPVLSLCRQLGADPTRSWMIGDYLFDVLSGRSAGAGTILMIGHGPAPDFADQADHVITKLAEVLDIV